MILLKRNLKEMEYIPYEGESDIDPDTGLHTGEPVQSYGEPIPFFGNISSPSQYVNSTFYGEDIRYTHTLAMEPTDEFEVNEYGVIRYNGDTYEIRAVRPSLNYVTLALRKQTKNNAESGENEDGSEDDQH